MPDAHRCGAHGCAAQGGADRVLVVDPPDYRDRRDHQDRPLFGQRGAPPWVGALALPVPPGVPRGGRRTLARGAEQPLAAFRQCASRTAATRWSRSNGLSRMPANEAA
jgi:hypothetical protein